MMSESPRSHPLEYAASNIYRIYREVRSYWGYRYRFFTGRVKAPQGRLRTRMQDGVGPKESRFSPYPDKRNVP